MTAIIKGNHYMILPAPSDPNSDIQTGMALAEQSLMRAAAADGWEILTGPPPSWPPELDWEKHVTKGLG